MCVMPTVRTLPAQPSPPILVSFLAPFPHAAQARAKKPPASHCPLLTDCLRSLIPYRTTPGHNGDSGWMLWGVSYYITREPRAGPPPQSLPSREQPNPVRLGNIPLRIFPGRKTLLAIILCKSQKDRAQKKKKKERPPAWVCPAVAAPLPFPQAVGSVVGAGQPLPD